MSIRESEAYKNWCPFTRAAWARPDDNAGWKTTGGEVGFNRALIRPGSSEESIGKCIGSRCMAWRSSGGVEVRREVKMVGLTEARPQIDIERVGYCGLAGAPGLTDDGVLAAGSSASAMEAAAGGRDAQQLNPPDDSAVGNAETPTPSPSASRVGEG